MIQSNNGEGITELRVFDFAKYDINRKTQGQDDEKQVSLGLERFFELFEQVTGWKAEFRESRESQLRRKMIGMENEPPDGTVDIVDMSADWPAETPTCHREKCDQLIAELDKMLADFNSTHVQLVRARSALAAYAPDFVDASEEVVDSFIPRSVHARERRDDDVNAVEVESEEVSDSFADDIELDVCQNVDESTLVKFPFAGWSLGGCTGITGSTYVDWRVDSNEQVSLSVGKLASMDSDDDKESTITVDPLSSEYFLTDEHGLNSFFFWDSLTSTLSPAVPFTWSRIRKGDAIIASTFNGLNNRDEPNQSLVALIDSADKLVAYYSKKIRRSERLLVLMRD